MIEEQKPVKICNPLKKDLSYEWFDDSDQSHMLKAPSMQIVSFPYGEGKFIAKRLTDDVCIDRGIVNNEEEWKKVYNEVIIHDEL